MFSFPITPPSSIEMAQNAVLELLEGRDKKARTVGSTAQACPLVLIAAPAFLKQWWHNSGAAFEGTYFLPKPLSLLDVKHLADIAVGRSDSAAVRYSVSLHLQKHKKASAHGWRHFFCRKQFASTASNLSGGFPPTAGWNGATDQRHDLEACLQVEESRCGLHVETTSAVPPAEPITRVPQGEPCLKDAVLPFEECPSSKSTAPRCYQHHFTVRSLSPSPTSASSTSPSSAKCSKNLSSSNINHSNCTLTRVACSPVENASASAEGATMMRLAPCVTMTPPALAVETPVGSRSGSDGEGPVHAVEPPPPPPMSSDGEEHSSRCIGVDINRPSSTSACSITGSSDVCAVMSSLH